MRTSILSVVLAALAVASGAAQTPGRYTFSGDHLAFYNIAGIVRVEPATGAAVTVDVQRGGHDADKLKVETGPVRGHDGLRVIYPDDDIVYGRLGDHSNSTLSVRDDGTFGDDDGGHRGWGDGRRVRVSGDGEGVDAYADLRIGVPAGRAVIVHLGVGRVTISNVDGNLRIDVASADVSATGSKGALTVSSGSGDVQVTDAGGALELNTGSGDVTLTGLSGGTLRAETGSGDVTANRVTADEVRLETGSGDLSLGDLRAPRVHLETGSGDTHIGLLTDVESLEANTGSGGITLNVPSTLGAQIEIETGSGEIDLGGVTIQVQKIENDHLRGTIGSGKGRIHLEAGSGDVRLVKI